MYRVFRQRLKSGNGTKPYPLTPEPAPPAFRGQVTLDTARCQGDGACMRVCPSAAISVEETESGWTWSLTDARCVFCGLCEEACPHDAIVITNAFELAVRDRADLETRAVFEREKAGTP